MNNLMSSIERNPNPFPVYAEMRRDAPVYYDPERGSYHVFRYDDVQRVLSDSAIFSSQFAGNGSGEGGGVFAASMISTDPPRHRQLRGLVTQAFTPRAVEALAPRIKEIVREHLDAVMEAGEMDVIRDLGYPLPVIVIAELMGIPPEDRERFKHWSDKVVSMADMGDEVDPQNFMSDEIMEMSMYFMNMLEERKQHPKDDFLTGLLQAKFDGEGLSEMELLGFCALLLVAGNETTTNLIGNAMLTFSQRPEVWQRLRQKPELIPQAIEEVLRYRSPVQAMFRVTKEAATVAGVEIPARSSLVAWIGSANHDEGQFPDAETYKLDRTPNRHLGFGQGIHYCLGAPLARLEARITLEDMVQRFASVERTDDAPIQRLPSLIVFGPKQLPIRFESAIPVP
jgi:cytochrome P450